MAGGIARVLKASPPAPIARLLAPYLEAVGPHDAAACPASYPGSPAIAQALLRPQDRIALCEAHPEEREALVAALGRDSRLSIVGTDGYVALNAYCPPKERRGLVLIDPPFEEPDESKRVEEALARAIHKWPTGNLCRLAADPRCGRRRALSRRGRCARRAEHPENRTRRRAGSSSRPRPGAAGARRPPRGQPAAYPLCRSAHAHALARRAHGSRRARRACLPMAHGAAVALPSGVPGRSRRRETMIDHRRDWRWEFVAYLARKSIASPSAAGLTLNSPV